MATLKQRIRDKLKRIFIATTGSTADRDTKCDDYQNTLRIPNWFTAAQWRKMKADVEG